MAGNKAMRRAMGTKDAYRLDHKVPLMTTETVMVTPKIAEEMLKRNSWNRPINWKKVEEYQKAIEAGEWELIPQGIDIDSNGDIVNGQCRLLAIQYSGQTVAMRVTKGVSPRVVHLIDRGRPQSERDLASRRTRRKHSPLDTTIARGILMLSSIYKPTKDQIAAVIVKHNEKLMKIDTTFKGTKKNKSMIMILAALCHVLDDVSDACLLCDSMAKELDSSLAPDKAEQCWNKGPAFMLAMCKARDVVASKFRK